MKEGNGIFYEKDESSYQQEWSKGKLLNPKTE